MSLTPSGLAIFASGRGSNAEKIIHYFDKRGLAVSCIVASKPTAGVLELADSHNIPSLVLNRKSFYESEEILDSLDDLGIKLIALAGFLWLIPPYLIRQYPKRIINIHPALLPEFGGKGMYGKHVHDAVHKAGRDKSGMTIHIVNEEYDKGKHLFQASCAIDKLDKPEDIAAKVLKLEHQFYPIVSYTYLRFLGH